MSTDRFRRYQADPLAFVDEVLRVDLWSKQREVVAAIAEHDRVAVKAGNAVGKTTAAAVTMLAWLAGGPGSVVVATSPTEMQLRNVLLRETHARRKQARGFFAGATITNNEIRLGDHWFLLGFSTDVPEALQGIHAPRVLVVVDEASGVEEAKFDAIEGLLAGGHSRVLLISNPRRTSGTFFDAFHSRRDEWHQITISAFDSPAFTSETVSREARRNLVTQKWVEQLEKRESGGSEFAIKVLGDFALAADDVVVGRESVETAKGQQVEPGLPLVVGCDIARFGADETVLYLRRGNHIRYLDSWKGTDLMTTTGRIVDHARRVQSEEARRPRIVVDDAGLGGGVTDRLREQGFDVVAFNGAGRARHPRDYPNRRSELWFTTKEVMSLLDLDAADEELERQLLAPTFSFDSAGARVVEAKSSTRKRLRRSPDRADAMMLTLVVDPPAAPGRERRLPSWSIPKGQIPTPERADSMRRPWPLLSRFFDRSEPFERTPPSNARERGGFVYTPLSQRGQAAPERRPVGVESRGGLVSQHLRGIRLKPRGTAQPRNLRRGLHVPRNRPASLDEISAATGIEVHDRHTGLRDLDALMAKGRRGGPTPEPLVDPLEGLRYDHQAELDGYLGSSE